MFVYICLLLGFAFTILGLIVLNEITAGIGFLCIGFFFAVIARIAHTKEQNHV